MNSLLGRLRKALGALRAARGGNVTITFALAVIPVVGFTGAAVDYSRGNSVKAALQAAADAGALYAAKADYPSDDARVTAGVNSFNANYASKLATASPTVTVGGGTVTVVWNWTEEKPPPGSCAVQVTRLVPAGCVVLGLLQLIVI